MTSTRAILGKLLSRAWRDESGGVLVYTAILLPVVLGFAGLSTDVGLWYMNKRVLQSSAAPSMDASRAKGEVNVADPEAIPKDGNPRVRSSKVMVA